MNQLLVHKEQQHVLVRIIGRASYKNSSALRDYGYELVEKLQEDSHLLLDMKDCQGLDSTFMGMLASWSHTLSKAGKPGLIMLDVQKNIAECITTLGLSRMISWSPAGESPVGFRNEIDTCAEWIELESEEKNKVETATHMLEAHEKLIEIEEGNRSRFREVLNCLKQKIRGS